MDSLTHSQVKKNHCGRRTPSQVSNHQCSCRVTVKNFNLDVNLRLLPFLPGPSLQGGASSQGHGVWLGSPFFPFPSALESGQPPCTSHFSDCLSCVPGMHSSLLKYSSLPYSPWLQFDLQNQFGHLSLVLVPSSLSFIIDEVGGSAVKKKSETIQWNLLKNGLRASLCCSVGYPGISSIQMSKLWGQMTY